MFSVMPYDKLGFIDKERYYIVHDSRGIIWISTYGNGLFAYDPATESIQHLHPIRVSLLYWLPIICNV